MRQTFRSAVLGICFALAVQAVAQQPQQSSDKGAFEQFGFSTSHDSSVGWTTELDTAIGYDLNRAFTVQAGVPLYLVSAKSTTTTMGTTQTSQQYNSVGDAFFGMSLHPKFDSYAFALGFVGTVPTGSRSNGISTGRVTGTLGGRLEKDFGRLTPFAEGTLGNSLGNTTRVHRPYTTLGAVSTVTGGTSIDFTDRLSFEASAYDVLPFGDQKVYSHNGKQTGGSSGHGRSFENAPVTSGGASLTKDHGFSGMLGVSPTRRVGLEFGYTRSIAYALDTYSGGVSFRLGHLAQNGKKQ